MFISKLFGIPLMCSFLSANIQFHPGKNVGLGKDHTIFSLIDGLVKFEKFGPDRKQVNMKFWKPFCHFFRPSANIITFSYDQISVYPRVPVPENPNSYRARKRESFRLQRERRKARKEGIIAQPQLVLASVSDAAETKPNCWCCMWAKSRLR